MPTGDVLQRQRVARLDVGTNARHHLVANSQALRRQDVALLTVFVGDQGDEGGAVRIIFQLSLIHI